MPKPNRADYALYLVTDPQLNRSRPVLEQVRQALQGGVRIVQLREKKRPDSTFITLAEQALALCRSAGAWLIINDRVEVAFAAGADGVHLGRDDLPLAEARRRLGEEAIIGASVSDPRQALLAVAAGADYLAVNGIFPTATKSDLGELPGLPVLTVIGSLTQLPLLGIGGINETNCAEVVAAGADGVAVVTAVTMADDMAAASRSLLRAVQAAQARRGENLCRRVTKC